MGAKIGAAVVIFAWGICLFLLVRPGSKGPTLVESIGNGVSGVVKAGTGGGSWTKA